MPADGHRMNAIGPRTLALGLIVLGTMSLFQCQTEKDDPRIHVEDGDHKPILCGPVTIGFDHLKVVDWWMSADQALHDSATSWDYELHAFRKKTKIDYKLPAWSASNGLHDIEILSYEFNCDWLDHFPVDVEGDSEQYYFRIFVFATLLSGERRKVYTLKVKSGSNEIAIWVRSGQPAPPPPPPAPEPTYSLDMWIGDGRFGSTRSNPASADTLMASGGYSRGYSLFVWSHDLQTPPLPLNGCQIEWVVDDNLVRIFSDFSTRTYHDYFQISDPVAGLACCEIEVPPDCPDGTYPVTARIPDFPDHFVTFNVLAIHASLGIANDMEMPDCTQGFPAQLFDKQRPDLPSFDDIRLGDGLWPESDNDDDSANLKMQINWRPDAYLTPESISIVVDSVQAIFLRAGIYVHALVDTAINTNEWSELDFHEMRRLLKESKKHENESQSGRWNGSVHVVLGGVADLGQYERTTSGGILICFDPYSPDPTSVANSMHVGTTDLTPGGENDSLNSCGIFVFSDDPCYLHTPNDGKDFWGTTDIALALAHELGHAVGLSHTWEDMSSGVMAGTVDPVRFSYANYADFELPPVAERLHFAVVNLRRLTGRDVASFTVSPLVP